MQRYAALGQGRFDEDELIQSWVLRRPQVIGEAARALTPEFREAHGDIPWRDIIGMRHILVHHYFGIDLRAVWSAVGHLPALKRSLTAILGEDSDAGAAGPTGERSDP